MIDRYRVYSTTGLCGGHPLGENTWQDECNELIKKGWIPLGGVVHYGNYGMMQTMYLPIAGTVAGDKSDV